MRRLAFLIVLIVLAGCSPPSFVAQPYRNFTAYYNTFYNAQGAFEQGVASLESADTPVDRGQYLSVFVPPDRVTGGENFVRAIQKSADILRNHPESKWVDDALLLIGKSYFYQQNYVGASQKFREAIALESGLEGEARFWLARSLIQSGAYEAAETHLRTSLDEGNISFGTWTAMMQLARGELYARQERWEESAVALDRGLGGEPEERPAARAAFLLGQVRETLGVYSAAARAYEVVTEAYRPRYELAFAAQMSAIRVRGQHGEAEEALDYLRRMERDDKNFEKRAEMALLRGQLFKAMGQPDQARQAYHALLYENDDVRGGGAVRGRVHYALGALYQDAYDDFSAAAAHFDTAATSLDRSRFTSTETLGVAPAAIRDSRARADLFRNLADRAALVSRLDSLLYLGSLSEAEFQDAVDRIRARRAAEEARQQRRVARRAAAQRFGTQPQVERAGTVQQQPVSAAGGEAGFLFHQNPVQAQEARRNFEQRWGQRPLVPNWRRLDAIRSQGGGGQVDGPVDRPDVALNEAAAPSTPNAAVIDVSAVPRDSTSQAQMRARRAIARYEFANALFLSAARPDSAAVWYQRVIDEDTGQPVAQRALYALAEVYQAQGDSAAARDAYQQVIDRYPQSPFAQRARQQIGQSTPKPAAADSLVQAEAAYTQAYTAWEARADSAALHQFVHVAERYARTPVAAKALWAATTVFLRQHADQPRTPTMLLPPVFGRVLEAVDTSAVLQASRSAEAGLTRLGPHTLSDLLAFIASQYPETPQAQRARSVQEALAARHPELLPAVDSTSASDSMRITDSMGVADSMRMADSTQAGTARIDPAVVDSAAIDSVLAAFAPDAVPPDSVGADSLRAVQADTASTETLPGPSANTTQRLEEWIIVVASHTDLEPALRMRRDYTSQVEQEEGVAIRVRTAGEGEAMRYQVTAGPFASEADAEAAKERFSEWLPAAARVAPRQ